jgi:carbonic anhydrase
MMTHVEQLLLANKSWAQEKKMFDPNYFERMAVVQTPSFLWIGCSDSRVPANEITGTNPGEIFVHRNVANMVVHTDLNLLTVLSYAVEVLKVKHIIVCGHYGCGGVQAALGTNNFGLINKWLRNIKDVYRFHKDEIDTLTTTIEKTNRLVELNVAEQILNLAKTSIVQKAWKEEQRPSLHGWVYGLDNGLIKEIVMMDSMSSSGLDPVYEYDF